MPPCRHPTGSAYLAAALLTVAACAAQEPRVRLRVVPPEALPAAVKPVDADGDGFLDARDPCPQAAEDGAPPLPEDGCPADAARPPAARVPGAGSDAGGAPSPAPSAGVPPAPR